MTLPDERRSAVSSVRQFLRDLIDPKKTPKVPAEIRKRARELLKHYPAEYDLNLAAKGAPDVFGVWREWPKKK